MRLGGTVNARCMCYAIDLLRNASAPLSNGVMVGGRLLTYVALATPLMSYATQVLSV